MSRINNYRSFRREQEREFNKLTKGYVVREDKEFESMCDSYLSNEIKISDFDNYLNRSLFLDINESLNNFDEYGNLINEELEWLNKAIEYVKDKSKAAFNVAISFFESILAKVKSFIKSLTKFITDKDKMMELLSSFVDKLMSGLKYFGDFLKKNKKGLYTLLVKVCVSLGITATVSYLLSFFGPGWVVAMSAKTGASAVSQKLKVGDKIASKVVRNESSKIKNYSQFINEAEESKVKKVASLLGKGIIDFFKVLKKFKIAVLIFLGAIWIIGHMFSPFNNFLDPIFEATQMTSLSDVFKTDFITSAESIPLVKVNSEVSEINVQSIKIPTLSSEDDLGINEIQASSTEQLDAQVSGIKGEILENPKEFCEAQSKLINELKSQIVGEESQGIAGVDIDNANELTQDGVEQTTGGDVEDIASGHGCFVSGTLVTLFNGKKLAIEDVEEGNTILTYNVETNVQELGIVKSLINLRKNDIVSIKLSNGTKIKCTSEHPFWVVNKGWSSFSPEKSLLYHDMNIEKLMIGDVVLTDSNVEVTIDEMELNKDKYQDVYNFEINGNHTYYSNGILVHNKMASDGDEGPGDRLKNLKKAIKDKSDEIKGNIKDKVQDVKGNIKDKIDDLNVTEGDRYVKDLHKGGWEFGKIKQGDISSMGSDEIAKQVNNGTHFRLSEIQGEASNGKLAELEFKEKFFKSDEFKNLPNEVKKKICLPAMDAEGNKLPGKISKAINDKYFISKEENGKVIYKILIPEDVDKTTDALYKSIENVSSVIRSNGFETTIGGGTLEGLIYNGLKDGKLNPEDLEKLKNITSEDFYSSSSPIKQNGMVALEQTLKKAGVKWDSEYFTFKETPNGYLWFYLIPKK